MKCSYCKKREIEEDSLFTRLCKECSGQNELILKTKMNLEKEFPSFVGAPYENLM